MICDGHSTHRIFTKKFKLSILGSIICMLVFSGYEWNFILDLKNHIIEND